MQERAMQFSVSHNWLRQGTSVSIVIRTQIRSHRSKEQPYSSYAPMVLGLGDIGELIEAISSSVPKRSFSPAEAEKLLRENHTTVIASAENGNQLRMGSNF